MARKKHRENLWDRRLAQKTIINALELLKKENPEIKDGYFSQADIREKVLEIGVDFNGKKVEWKVIKSTFYHTLKKMDKAKILISKRKDRINKYHPYSFYKINKYKDDTYELKESIKDDELVSLKMELGRAPLYSYDIGILTNMNLPPVLRDEFMRNITQFKTKLKKCWVEEEIEYYLDSLIKSIKTNKPKDDVTSGLLLGYGLDHLNWWIRKNQEDPKNYQNYINKRLKTNKIDRDSAKEYQKNIRDIYENKRKWIDEIAKRIWMTQEFIQDESKESNIKSYRSDFLNKLKEVGDEGHFTEEEIKWLSIHIEASAFHIKSHIYSLPKEIPILIINL
jgi:hypothetical protein